MRDPMQSRPKWVFLTVVAVGLLTLARTQQFYGNIYRGWDAQFYYSCAHSLVFDRDVDVTNNLLLTPYPLPFDPDRNGSWKMAPRRSDGGIPSKYPIGMSLLEAPLLGLGHLARQAAEAAGVGVPGTIGYSAIELWCVAVGLIFLFSFGIVVLYRLVAEDFGRPAAVLGVIACWMGTSLFYYSVVFPFMAHAISFVLLVLVMHLTRALLVDVPANRSLALLGLCLAATFLVRPQQIMVAAFLLPSLVRLVRIQPTATWAAGAAIGATAIVAAVAAQVGMNYSQFGKFMLSGYSVGSEGFAWLNPHLTTVLVSASRGLLVFSPVVVMAALGYILFAQSVPGYAWPAVGNAVAQVYLIAAWSSPDQGDAFGARMWSDNAAAVAVGLAVLFHRSSAVVRWIIGGATLTTVCWTTYLMARYIGLVD